jgi:mono/diheme cytochrome c family protein
MLLCLGGAALTIVLSETVLQSVAARPPDDGEAFTATAADASDDDGNPINGRKVFLRENCYSCHGGRAGGGMCPSLREDPPDESDIDDVIEEGTENGMPSYEGRVSEREIEDLAAYFETLRTPREPTFTHWWEPGIPSQ